MATERMLMRHTREILRLKGTLRRNPCSRIAMARNASGGAGQRTHGELANPDRERHPGQSYGHRDSVAGPRARPENDRAQANDVLAGARRGAGVA
jgi:hypothetical protein